METRGVIGSVCMAIGGVLFIIGALVIPYSEDDQFCPYEDECAWCCL